MRDHERFIFELFVVATALMGALDRWVSEFTETPLGLLCMLLLHGAQMCGYVYAGITAFSSAIDELDL